MAKALIVGLLLLLVAENEASAFRWPWEQHRVVRRPARSATEPPALADCKAISAAARRMSAIDFQEAMRLSTDQQKKTIARCLKESP